MSIRAKLFLSFIAVVAVPLVMLLVTAHWYWRSARAELDQRFVEDAKRVAVDNQETDWRNIERLKDLAEGRELRVRYLDTQDASTPFSPNFPSQPFALSALPGTQAITGYGFWDGKARIFTSWKSRDGRTAPAAHVSEMLDKLSSIAAAKDGPLFYSTGDFGDGRGPDARYYVHSGGLVLEVDPRLLFPTVRFGNGGRAFLVDHDHPYEANAEPELAVLARYSVRHGETRDVRDDQGRLVRIYAAISGETSTMAVDDGLDLFVTMPLDEIYAPLGHFGYKVGGAVALSLLLALALASRLSRRFVGDIERIRETVAAIGRGDWKRLEASSNDELGGALVNSVNEMAASLAARSMREETEGWRRLVRVLSHEINNTLAPVRSVAATMQSSVSKRLRDDDAGADLDRALRLIVERVDALSSFIAGSAEVAKVPEPQRQLVDVDQLVEDAARMFNEQANARALHFNVGRADESAGTASIDVRQVERVVVNLVKNAMEAVPTGGSVWVTSARRGGEVEVLVEDDGHGISVDARRSLFVPYFTTKKGGSGIGLALVKQIVVAHGGTVTAEDRSGGGTRMRVRLPGGASTHPYRDGTAA